MGDFKPDTILQLPNFLVNNLINSKLALFLSGFDTKDTPRHEPRICIPFDDNAIFACWLQGASCSKSLGGIYVYYGYALKFWEKIAKLPVEGIFLTFTDRIFNSLPLLWLLDVKLPPITFLSTGKRIPEDISRGEGRILKNFFLRGIEKR